MRKSMLTIAAAALALVPAAAEAACRPAQIRGDWTGIGVNSELGWIECLVTVGPNGRTTSTRCRGSGFGFAEAGIWQIAVAPSCRVSGRTGADARLVGALSADGQSFSAVVLDEDDGIGPRVIDKFALFSFTFHRR